MIKITPRARPPQKMCFGRCSIQPNLYLIINAMFPTSTNCNGVTRRDFIQVGLGGMLGLGLCDLLRLRAVAGESPSTLPKKGGKNVNCILIWMDGGPSHYETFDPKPDAPSEIRGEFKAIATKLPGVQF